MSQQFEPIAGRTPSPISENNETEGYSSNFADSSSLQNNNGETGESTLHNTHRRFDWLATGVVVSIAAIFTLAARLQPQPSTSFVPIVVLSATGYGLLITALRKLRAGKGVGLGEAALAGFSIALFQWILALTYPGVISSLSNVQLAGPGFFTTWGLVAFFSVLFSMIGATLGHMSFAPLRSLPTRTGAPQTSPTEEVAEEAETGENLAETVDAVDTADAVEEQENDTEEENESAHRPVMSYVIAILMLGLAPILVGYVFAGSFDFALNHFGYDPGPFSTLRLLSALLPWQIPVPITLSGANGVSTLITLLWRIPLFFGNPSIFDIQALEPFAFNAAGLALLLILDRREESGASGTPWGRLLIFEGLLGLLLVVPADLWIIQGLQGVLQIQSTVLPIGTLNILNTSTFTLNIMTGPLICIAVGALMTRLRPAPPASGALPTQPTGQ